MIGRATFNVIASTDGSVQLENGLIDVICAVSGPVEAKERAQLIDRAILEIQIDTVKHQTGTACINIRC